MTSDDSLAHSPLPAWQIRAEMALATAAMAGHLITYADLADAANVPAPHRIHQITQWLEDMLEQDHAAGQPLRAARVISRSRDGLPAPGFFMKCAALGLYDGPHDGPAAHAFHQSLLAG